MYSYRNLQLLNSTNSFAGTITINAGRLTVREDSALGNAANAVVLNGGIFDAQVFDASIARNFTVGTAGGAIVSVPFGKSRMPSPSCSSESTTMQCATNFSQKGSAIINAKHGASTTDATAL